MKANEFIKKFGWTGFKIACRQRAIDRHKYTIIWSDEIGFSNEINEIDADWTFESKEVLRLVESHELIGGDLEYAKKFYADCAFKRDKHLVRYKQAIADVESCQ
ncbi:hypothetical protein HX116_09890 [Acinetobacter towneri]|uniref:hypothetical protein n=1 Tax=Acinetobacter towneri TaxID=202956 RepID=UPI00257883E2|nr:hypothetical protein [Acinetobacter towneri]MDM1731461.1 hypothetical protein [Acinetobacter towneri]MDM1734124.1 hypothetical protein [Acinetobacter towneri]MDM1739353.1 hypothetical protein [Acinetobacter towneri]MDM1742145.1 hypothetical protein [Acinetobacter towneri]MDM1744724.1 hypothetical protein [Acinetobacter towneri]